MTPPSLSLSLWVWLGAHGYVTLGLCGCEFVHVNVRIWGCVCACVRREREREREKEYRVCILQAATWENVPFEICAQKRIRSACASAVWSVSSAWRNFAPFTIQKSRMCRVIWIFAVRTIPKENFLLLRLINTVSYYGEVHILVLRANITKTYLYNFDPLKPHFYIVKLGFTGVYIIFLISAQKHRL